MIASTPIPPVRHCSVCLLRIRIREHWVSSLTAGRAAHRGCVRAAAVAAVDVPAVIAAERWTVRAFWACELAMIYNKRPPVEAPPRIVEAWHAQEQRIQAVRDWLRRRDHRDGQP